MQPVAAPSPMTVVFHADPDAFLAAARAVVSRSPASEAFVAAWCDGLKRRPPRAGTPLLFATCEIGDSRALALQHGPLPVVLLRSDPAASGAIADALAAQARAVPGVHGAEDACEAFAARWRATTGANAVLHARLRHHQLRAVREPPPAPGAMRAANADDADWLVEHLDRFVAESGAPAAPEGTSAMVEARLADGRYRIWERDGERVAFLGLVAATPRHGRIGPVWTPPGHRGRGYATSLVARASAELLARGVERVFLVTDLANPTSNAIYARVGYEPLEDDVEVRFVGA